MRKVTPLILRILYFIFFIFSLGACSKPDECKCLKSNGKQIEQLRNIEAFNKVELKDNVNLTIIQDTVNELLLNVPENLANFIVTDVKDSVLYISNENKCNWLRSFKIEIGITIKTNTLKNIDCQGSGVVKSVGFIERDYFEININEASGDVYLELKTNETKVKLHNGPANIYINGYSKFSSVYNAGNGFIFMQNFDTQYTDIRHVGTGQCHVKASDYLSATLEYVGDINYYGNPTNVLLIDKGDGKIIKH